MRIRRVLVVTASMVFIVLGMAMNASAMLVTTLNQGNPALIAAGYDGPYADVYITLGPSNTATVTFDALGDYLLGDGGIVAVNVNASSFGYTLPGGFTAGGSPGWTGGSEKTEIVNATTGGSNLGTFGSFNLVYDSFDGATCAVDSLTFVLTNTSSSIWNSPSDVLAWDAGWAAAGHIFTTSGVTGFAAAVPLPPTLALMGSGLAGLIGIGRFRRNRSK